MDDNKLPSSPPIKQKSIKFKANKRLALILGTIVLLMFGFSYAMVPIFTFVCKQMGINGKGGLSVAVVKPDMQVDLSRTITIEFTATIPGSFNFKFAPRQHRINLHPGERKTIYFYAENLTGVEKTVQAIPSITPADGARFFKKIECFCFTQQHFLKDEKANMFVNFYIDPAIPKDIKELTLSYTLMDATGFEKVGKQISLGREKS